MRKITGIISALILIAALLPLALRADNRTYGFSGGTFLAGTAVGNTIAVKSAPLSTSGATLTFSCPITAYGAGLYQVNWGCQGGSVSIVSANKSLLFAGQFVSATMVLTASGGGKGSHYTESYRFAGEFSGTITANGVTQRAYGSVNQLVQSGSLVGAAGVPVTSGSFGWSSAYSPLIVGDNAKGRLVAADNITGANLAAYGSAGRGTGQFTAIAGIAEDSAGHIYVVDSGADRVVRMDDLTGRNWLELGSYGTGNDHFNAPSAMAVDPAGKIWVVDSGNNRIVRLDDMLGTNWTAFGVVGTGKDQFKNPKGIAFDPQGIIYVADTGNNRVVRFSDLKGTNWASLAAVSTTTAGTLLTAPQAIATGAGGSVYIALGGATPSLVRTTFPAGTGSTVSTWSNPITSISVDKAGTVYVAGQFQPGLAQMNDAVPTGYFASALGGAVQGPGPVFARPSATPPPAAPLFSGSALNFGSHNIGEPGSPLSLTLTNLGAGALTLEALTAGAEFPITRNCPVSLTGGAACVVSVEFDAKATGPQTSALVLTSNGVHPTLEVGLSGVGTMPHAIVLPSAMQFIAQTIGTSSVGSEVTLTNTGSGPLTIASITTSGPFGATSDCGEIIAAGAGCSIYVSFKPTASGAQAGTLTISDDAAGAGTHQSVTLSGTAVAGMPPIGLTPENVQFPDEEVGSTSGEQVITLSNLSAASLTLGKATFPAAFKVTSTCGASLAKAARCTFSVAFAPQAAGAVSGTLAMAIGGQPTLAIGLSGTGNAAGKGPALKFSPATVNFGAVAVGDDVVQAVTVSNSSALPVAIQSSIFSAASGLTLMQNTCPAIIAGLASCSFSIQFSPVTAASSYSGTLTVTEGSGARILAAISGQSVAGSN